MRGQGSEAPPLALRAVLTKLRPTDTDLYLCHLFWGPWGTGVLQGPGLENLTGPEVPSLVPDGPEDQRKSWMRALQIPTLARENKPHIIQSEGAEGQGRWFPWFLTQRKGTQCAGRGQTHFPCGRDGGRGWRRPPSLLQGLPARILNL